MASKLAGVGLLLCLLKGCTSREQLKTKQVSEVLDHLLDGYNKEVRPGIGGKQVEIDTSIKINSMGPISENDMSYSMQVYFRQRWRDKRLSFYLPNITEFTLANRFINNIWKPNSYFINGRNSKQHNITTPNAFIRLSHDGSIYMSMRLTVNARCPMMLSRYPMDRAVCPLFIGSFGYTTDDLVYKWENKVEVDPAVGLSQYQLGVVNQDNTSKSNRWGEFSILEVYIHLSRAVGFYVLQTYVPCVLIVSLSWISFWINRDAAPARVLLGVTTMLSTATIGMTVREGLPRVPYATALDVFLNVCVVYEMAALIEYAAVNYFTKKMKEKEEDKEEDNNPVGGTISNRKVVQFSDGPYEQETLLRGNHVTQPGVELVDQGWESDDETGFVYCVQAFWNCLTGNQVYRNQRKRGQDVVDVNTVSQIDLVARFLFPATFGLFNLCYWVMYLYLELS